MSWQLGIHRRSLVCQMQAAEAEERRLPQSAASGRVDAVGDIALVILEIGAGRLLKHRVSDIVQPPGERRPRRVWPG